MLTIFSIILLLLIGSCVLYLYVLAAASLRPARPINVEPHAQYHSREKLDFSGGQTSSIREPSYSFAVVIPAHNEEAVIAATVSQLLEQNYPRNLYSIFVIADHCTDRTANAARSVGAICFERTEGPRGSKGAALSWFFAKLFQQTLVDAVVIFDADTRVDCSFLRIMDVRLREGISVIQGCHRILNWQDGWFAALTWAMFIIDNRFQNLGRTNLGWSAKHMGDSVCFRADIIKRFGWGQGLTEDYEFRQKLLLQYIRIAYEPAAIGYGEAPASWSAARTQRSRWLSGTLNSSRKHSWEMLKRGLGHLDGALLDGALQAVLPSYSTLTLFTSTLLILHLASVAIPTDPILPPGALVWPWLYLTGLLSIYPLIGLMLERAPLRAYLAILLGPFFIVWRTILSLRVRLGRPVTWVRTERRSESLNRSIGN